MKICGLHAKVSLSAASESSIFDHLINIWEFNFGAVPGTFSLYFLHLKSFGHTLLTTTLVAGIDSTIQFTISKRRWTFYVHLAQKLPKSTCSGIN
ncbi:hypothetical protein J1N35_029321 [Gossypium stocksii]|uniref:Uncharacterized protein n=1 Tax=Gossypium stocksii TaxID=47602 RepID=A0A9D3UYI4_9ROSI|nr:hypothetical protein J1N35_029321 [Gossypium stocksii]